MKRSLVSLLLIAVTAVGVHAAVKSISWKKGYSVANATAKSSGKLMMIDMYTDWCTWCKKLDSDTYPAPAVVSQSERFVPLKLNAEKDADGIRLAKKFKVDGYPTILFIDSNENLAYKIVGYSPPKEFAANMAKAATIRHDRAKFRTALAANPNDFTALVGMAGIEASIGNADKAATLVDRAARSATPSQRGKMLDAYSAVGDGYQNSGQFDKAVGYFKKSIDVAYPRQTAYARISIAACLAQSNKAKDAVPYLEALLKMSDAPKEYLDQARQMLAAIKAQP